jgi:predicted transcriptional regulator YdeE
MMKLPAARFNNSIVTALIVFSLSPVLTAQEAAKPKMEDQSSFDVIGISARTNNAAETGPNGEIPKLWQRLFAEGVSNQIPDRTGEEIVAVYTNYASDWNGDYTYILGAKVKPGSKAPGGMVAVTIAPGKYEEFVTATGPGQEVVPAAWRQIYAYFQQPGVSPRAYKTDFETYAPTDPANVQGHIFIGVK